MSLRIRSPRPAVVVVPGTTPGPEQVVAIDQVGHVSTAARRAAAYIFSSRRRKFFRSSCFLVKPNMQLADPKKKLCADCV